MLSTDRNRTGFPLSVSSQAISIVHISKQGFRRVFLHSVSAKYLTTKFPYCFQLGIQQGIMAQVFCRVFSLTPSKNNPALGFRKEFSLQLSIKYIGTGFPQEVSVQGIL
jgi:hypothetical protein